MARPAGVAPPRRVRALLLHVLDDPRHVRKQPRRARGDWRGLATLCRPQRLRLARALQSIWHHAVCAAGARVRTSWYWAGEASYVVLSFTAKAWLVLLATFNVLLPSSQFDELLEAKF